MNAARLPPEVAAAFAAFPPKAQAGLKALRALILDEAASLPEIGRLEEALRWGQPAYLTPETKAGTTIRLGQPKSASFALFVHCQTSLIEEFKALAGEAFRTESARAVLFDDISDIQPDLLRLLIRRALTYHLGER